MAKSDVKMYQTERYIVTIAVLLVTPQETM